MEDGTGCMFFMRLSLCLKSHMKPVHVSENGMRSACRSECLTMEGNSGCDCQSDARTQSTKKSRQKYSRLVFWSLGLLVELFLHPEKNCPLHVYTCMCVRKAFYNMIMPSSQTRRPLLTSAPVVFLVLPVLCSILPHLSSPFSSIFRQSF